jgi:2-polyprenyl-3-methyl-5-hydroxy-6-metoxy-1,4-benzoquinol methylase
MRKGWFKIPGQQTGDRTLEEQLIGLDDLILNLSLRTVFEIGCAEGLISMKLCDEGALAVHGIEIVPGHVEVANRLRDDRPCTFEVADANTYVPRRSYDIVLMLAVLHKLKDPTAACKRFARAARDLVVIRLPPGSPVISDKRSGLREHDMDAAMRASGFTLTEIALGHLGEWTGYYERISDEE